MIFRKDRSRTGWTRRGNISKPRTMSDRWLNSAVIVWSCQRWCSAGGAGNRSPLSRSVFDENWAGASRTDASPSQARRRHIARTGCSR
jgi:hypothetical protein